MPPDRDDTLARLATLSVSSVCDADKTLTPLDPGIVLIADHGSVCGPARLVAADDDHLPVLTAIVEATPGEVLVIANRTGRRAVIGELLAAAAAQRRLGGIVIDGYCRDVDGLRAAGITLYARGSMPASGSAQAIDAPAPALRVGGIDVAHGDLVLGDRDGVLIAPAERLRAALATAEQIEATERAVLAAIQAGRPIETLLDLRDHVARLQAGRESSLGFT